MSDITISKTYIPHIENADNSYRELRSGVAKLKTKFKIINVLNGFMLWLLSISIFAILWFVVGGMLQLNIIFRGVLMILFSLTIIASGYFFLLKTLLKRISVENMAYKIEQTFPELQDRLISSLQLWQKMPENKYGYSENLIRMTIEEARAIFERIDKTKILSDEIRKLKRTLIYLLAGLIPLIILIIAFPIAFEQAVQAFTNPFEKDDLLVNAEITKIMPGNVTIQPLQEVEIIAEVKSSAPEEAILHIKNDESDWQNMVLKRKGSSLIGSFSYSAKLSNINQSMEYYVSVMDIKSSIYQVKVAQKPVISNLQLEMFYPKYLGMTNQKLSPNVGDISAPVGTKVSINAESSKDIASSFIIFDHGEAPKDNAELKSRMFVSQMRNLNTSFIVKKSGTYYILVTDTDGINNSDPIKYSINAITDQPPNVNITIPGKNITLDSRLLMPLQIDIQDDHGIADIRLIYQIEGQATKTAISLGRFTEQQTNATIKYIWDINPIQLFPDDVVTYFVEATDFDNVSGPNIGRSSVYTARFPSLYEIYKQTEAEQEQQQSEMSDVLSEQKEAKKTADNLIKELKKKDQMEWTDKKELEKVNEMQKKIEEKMKSVAEQVDKTVKKMEENPLVNTDLLKKVQELRDLINEIATDEMKQIMKKLSDAMQKTSMTEKQKELMLASIKQEEIMEKLDRAIKLFKNMQIQQKLDVAVNLAKELERQQIDTLQRTEQLAKNDNSKDIELRANELASREERIKNQLEELQNDLQSLVEESKESNPAVSQMLEQVNAKSRQSKTSDKLQKACDALKCCNASQSMPFQKQALSDLSQLQKELGEVAESSKGIEGEEIIRVLREAIRKSLQISNRHEEITKAIASIKGDSNNMLQKEKEIVDSLASDQLVLAENIRRIATQLKELSFKDIKIDTELIWALQKSADGMQRSSKAMADKMITLAKPIQRSTLAIINSSIQNMLDSIEEMNSNASPSMSMDDYLEQLRQLADQQSQLNQSTQNAEGQMRRQGMMPSLQDLLEQLSAEQSLIREASERLASKLDDKAETMGSLEEVAREMKEVEKALREGYVDQETLDRQRRILTRLLDYEKSMKKQDYDKKREAQVGRDYIVEKPSSQLPSDANIVPKQIDTMLNPSSREQWPQQYRELIKAYYKSLSNKLNQNGTGK
ncbi:TPA: hypothetical protein ENS27_07105 [bacterium]|nr:hypothetical protein [bacterium]